MLRRSSDFGSVKVAGFAKPRAESLLGCEPQTLRAASPVDWSMVHGGRRMGTRCSRRNSCSCSSIRETVALRDISMPRSASAILGRSNVPRTRSKDPARIFYANSRARPPGELEAAAKAGAAGEVPALAQRLKDEAGAGRRVPCVHASHERAPHSTDYSAALPLAGPAC
jgi:hypothetical protein